MHAFSRFSDLLSGKTMFDADMGGAGPRLLPDFRLGYYRCNIIDAKADRNVEFDKTLNIPGINLGDYATSGT